MSDLLKFEGIPEGTYIRAYDFEPMEGRTQCFVEGTIKGVTSENGYKAYIISTEFDSWDEEDSGPKHSRVGSDTHVPMESTFDYDERVTVLPVLTKHPIEQDEDSANAVQWTNYGFRG